MEIFTIFWTVVATVIAGVLIEMILNRPKIAIPSLEGWTESKQINTFAVRDYSTDTDSRTEKEFKTRDYYNVYGIQIRNDKHIFSRINATITKATIKLWSSDGSAITDWYTARLWGGRSNASNEPLFPKKSVEHGRVIGYEEELDIVLAYNQENESYFYKFTVETHLQNNFKIYRDLLKEPLPIYGVIRLHGHRIINNKIFFVINAGDEKNHLKINVLSKDDFPILQKEMA
jgi:hypothetical protein